MSERRVLYSWVACLWGWVFLIVGCLFLLVPVEVGSTLTAWANLIGLSGSIASPSENLWHVLSLSLMATITVLAFVSAKQPACRGPYYALLVAKTVSTVAFAGLAVTQAPAWIICAVGDGFVGLTLWLSHLRAPHYRVALHPDFRRRYRGQSPFYEIWFGKINIAPGLAFWFRYTLLDGRRQEASVWAILFHDNRVETGKETTKIADLAPANVAFLPDHEDPDRFRNRPQVFHLGESRLDTENAVGKAGTLSWDLNFRNLGDSFEHVPKTLRTFNLPKSTRASGFLDLRCSGTIQNESQKFEFKDVPGMIGHISGEKQVQEWAWLHCNAFDGAPGVVLEGLSGRIKVASTVTAPLSSFVLYVGERCYNFSSVWRLFTAETDYSHGKWSFKVSRGSVTIEGEVVVSDPRNVAVVQYTDTDDSHLWCHNSKLADLSVRLIDKKEGIDKTYVATGTAAFEIVNRETPTREVVL